MNNQITVKTKRNCTQLDRNYRELIQRLSKVDKGDITQYKIQGPNIIQQEKMKMINVRDESQYTSHIDFIQIF